MTDVSLPFSPTPGTILVVQFMSSCLNPEFQNQLLDLPSNSSVVSDAQVNEQWSNEDVLPDETPEPFEVEPSIYLSVQKCKSLSFGRESCRIPLPNRRGISKKHFKLYMSSFSTWMISCNSRNALILNGVWVGKRCSRALDPSTTNTVEIPSVSVRILVHIVRDRPDENGTFLVEAMKPSSGDEPPASPEAPEDWSASGSTSTVTHLRWMGDVRQAETSSAYIVLTTMPMAWSSSAFSAIDAATGEECVALQFRADDSRRLVRFFLSYGQRLHVGRSPLKPIMPPLTVIRQHTHIVRSLKVERDPPLLAQSFNGRDYLSPGSISVDAACTVIQQITDALHAAHSMGFVHGHIQAEDIIYQSSDLHYRFVINGFWRRFMSQGDTEMPRPCTDVDKEFDYRSLSNVVMAGLLGAGKSAGELAGSGHARGTPLPSRAIKDYILREVLTAMTKTTATEHTWTYIQDLPSCLDLFDTVEVIRSISVDIRGTGRSAELRTSQLVRLWEHHIHSTLTEQATVNAEDANVLRLLRRYRSDFIRPAKLSTFLRLAASETTHLRAAVDAAVKGSATVVDFEVPVRVPCIGHMVNLTCFSRAMGVHVFQDLSSRTVQEVQGPYKHAGLYIRLESLKEILSEIDCGMLTWRPDPRQTALAQKVCDTDAREFVLIVTGLPWCVCVLMRRDDGRMDWDPFSRTGPMNDVRLPLITADESCIRCDEFGLTELKDVILRCRATLRRELPSRCPRQTLELLTEDVPESDTSIETDDSDQDNLKFKRRRTRIDD